MNVSKRLLSVILALALLLGMVTMMTACNDTDDTDGDGGAEGGGYTVTVKTAGGMPMEGVAVYVYADDSLKDLKEFKETDAEGKVSFDLAKSKKYAITVDGVPKGYAVEKSYKFDGNTANITLTSSLIKGESLAGATLGVGDVMYDFEVTDANNKKIVLSEILKEKKAVLINFFFTTCSPCVTEFPYMQEAYDNFKDDIGIVALDPLDGNNVPAFQKQMGLTFPMAACNASWSTSFGITGYPTSILVDRYGLICLVEVGGLTSLNPFTQMFEHFTADDYEQKLFPNGLSDLITSVKPTFKMDDPKDIAAAINADGAPITYRAEEGEDAEYTWPFILTEKDGKKCVKASNQDIDGSYAILYADVELKTGQAIGFDYLCSSEKSADILYVIVDGEDIYQISGDDENKSWKTCYPWVAAKDGKYEVALCYIKDESDKAGEDTVYIRNMRVMDASKITTATYIPRLAATETDEGYDYVTIVYNNTDGYYHVGDKNGPLLLADLMNYTQFNEEETVYEMAYNGDFTVDGHNYYDELVDYCNYASNSTLNGVCTVNKELAELLKIVDKIAGFDEDENEWLKICKYYQVYGTKTQLEDPIKGLTPSSAYTAKLGKNVPTNYFYYNRVIMPRGLLAEFIPSKSGAYRITSRNESTQGVDAWIFDENHKELLVYEQDERMYNDEKNVSMVFYMEKGKKYYIDIAFWDLYEVGYIYYDIEYIAPSYKLFRLCSPGYFTYDGDATGETMYYLIQGGIDVVLKDGKYYEDLGKDKNGKQLYGSLIYADFSGITSLFSNPIATVPAYNENGTPQKDENGKPVYIKGMIDMGGFDFSKTEDDLYILAILDKYNGDQKKAIEYLKEQWGEEYDGYAANYKLDDVLAGKYHGTGPDLTAEIKTYLNQMSTANNETKGCVVVTERLAEILQMLVEKYTFENVDYAWLKLCYYYDDISANG